MSSNASNTIIALLVGAAVGAGLGLLLAPDKGTETRRKIKDKLKDGKDGLSEKIDEIIENLKGKFDQTEQKIDATIDELVAEGKEKTEDIIEVLEAKLAALKREVSGNN